MYSTYARTFSIADSWIFDNDIDRNVINFGVDNSSSSHTDNQKNKFLVLGDAPTFGISGRFGLSDKTQNFVWVCIITLIIVICLLIEKKTLTLRSTIKALDFPTQFCLGSMYNGFSATESRKASLNWNVYDFPVDYDSIVKSDILNFHEYLMIKNNIK